MNFLKSFSDKKLKYELIHKFSYNSIKKLPKLAKITLNFNCKTTDTLRLSSSLLALEIITYQKGKITTTKRPNILLKLRKGSPIGCRVELQKHRMYYFLERFLTEVSPRIKNFTGFAVSKKLQKTTLQYKLKDIFAFKMLEKQYHLFNCLQLLGVIIKATSKKSEELVFVLKSLQLPTTRI